MADEIDHVVITVTADGDTLDRDLTKAADRAGKAAGRRLGTTLDTEVGKATRGVGDRVGKTFATEFGNAAAGAGFGTKLAAALRRQTVAITKTQAAEYAKSRALIERELAKTETAAAKSAERARTVAERESARQRASLVRDITATQAAVTRYGRVYEQVNDRLAASADRVRAAQARQVEAAAKSAAGSRKIAADNAVAAALRGQGVAQRAQVDLEVNDAAARAKLVDLTRQLRTLDAAPVRVDVDDADARAKLLTLRAELARIDRETVNVRVKADASSLAQIHTGAQTATGGISALVLAAAAVAPAIVPIAAVGVPALAGLGAAGLGAAAGVGVAAMAIGPVVKAMEALAAADEEAAASAMKGNAARRAQAAAVQSAAAQVQSAERSLVNTRADVASQAVQAARRVTDAQAGVVAAEQSAARDIAAAQRAVTDARAQGAQRVRDSLAQVEGAERNLVTAQRSSLMAQQQLNDAREAARRSLQDMALQAKSVALQERSGVLQVAQARQDLARTMADPKADSLQRQQAKLAVDQALQGLEETRVSQARLAKDKAVADRAGVAGSRQVRDAQQQVADAALGVRDAQRQITDARAGVGRAQLDAARGIADAEARYNQARVDGAARVRDAQRQVTDAMRTQQDQARQGAFQVAQAEAGLVGAQRSLAQAHAQAGAAASAASTKAAVAMAALTPAGRAFVTFLRSQVMPAWQQLGRTAQNGFLPGLTQAGRMLTPLFGPLNTLVGQVAASLGRMAVSAATALTGPFWTRFFTFLSANLVPWLERFAAIAGNVFTGLAGLFMAAAPAGDTFTASIERMTARFAAWGASGGGPQFQAFLTYAQASLPIVGSFITQLALAFGNVTAAVAPLGPVVLVLLTNFARWVSTLSPGTIQAAAITIGVLAGALRVATLATTLANVAMVAYRTGVFLIRGVLTAAAVAQGIYTFATNAQARATMLATAQQWLLNSALLANPVGLVIVSLIALAGIFVLLWKRSETFRTIVTGAWNGIKAAAGVVVAWFQSTVWPALSNVLQWVGAKATWLWQNAMLPAWRGISAVMTPVFGWLRDTAWPILSTVFGLVAGKVSWLFTAYFKVYFALIKGVVQVVFFFFRDIIWPIFRNVAGWIVGSVLSLWDTFKKNFKFIKDTADTVSAYFRDTVWPRLRNALQWVGDKASWLWNHSLGPIFGWIKTGIGKVSTAFDTASAAIGRAWDKIRGFVKKPIVAALNIVENGLLGGIRKVASFVSLDDKVPSLKESIAAARGMHSGGIVTGPYRGPRADNVLRRLNPREYVHPVDVVNREGVARHDALRAGRGRIVLDSEWDAIRRRVPGMYAGGLVGFGRAMQKMGWRASEHPAFGGVRGGHMKGSHHYQGRAIDFNWPGESGNWSPGERAHAPALIAAARKAGYLVYYGAPDKPNHVHVADTGGKLSGSATASAAIFGQSAADIVDMAKGVYGKAIGGLSGDGFAGVAKGLVEKIASGAWSFLTDKAAALVATDPSGSGVAGGNVQRWAGTVKHALAMLGQPARLLQTVLQRIQKESGGNPRAINNWDSNARRGTPSKGLLQVIDPTFNRYKMPGYDNIWDALSNILASFRYTIARYGSIAAGYNRVGGYASGTLSTAAGLALVGENGPELVNFRGRDRVYNAGKTQDMLAQSRGGGDPAAQADMLAQAAAILAAALGDAEFTLSVDGDPLAAKVTAKQRAVAARGVSGWGAS